ncbi:hypothetical protein ACFFRR_006856 [Megaselia abdita]
MTKFAILAICLFVGVVIVQGLPADVKPQPQSVQKEFKPQPLVPGPKEEDALEAGDEEKDLSASNTFGYGYYGYPRYYRSYYPSYYGGYGGYRGYYGHGYGGYYSPYRYYNSWY